MKSKIQKYGIFVVILIVIIVFIMGYMKEPVDAETEIVVQNNSYEQEVKKTYIYIDVKGEVRYPGVYKVEQDSRLFQVIYLAGGLTVEADNNAINQSVILKDQDVVYIPNISEEYPNITSVTTSDVGGVININSATLEQLETLPGIGPATAQSIIDYRNENGPFTSIEGIMDVSGIGEATYTEIKDYITT